MKVNQILYTKDGRQCGNAIIQKIVQFRETNELLFHCMTDYGSEIIFNKKEINSHFYLALVDDGDILGPPRGPHKNAVKD